MSLKGERREADLRRVLEEGKRAKGSADARQSGGSRPREASRRRDDAHRDSRSGGRYGPGGYAARADDRDDTYRSRRASDDRRHGRRRRRSRSYSYSDSSESEDEDERRRRKRRKKERRERRKKKKKKRHPSSSSSDSDSDSAEGAAGAAAPASAFGGAAGAAPMLPAGFNPLLFAQLQHHAMMGNPAALVQLQAMMRMFAGGGAAGAAALTPQQTRHARRLYIGQLPEGGCTKDELRAFFNATFAAIAVAPSAGDAVLDVYLNVEKRFAFVEFKSVALTNSMTRLDGIRFQGASICVKRPKDYKPHVVSPTVGEVPIDVSKLGPDSGLATYVLPAAPTMVGTQLPSLHAPSPAAALPTADAVLGAWDGAALQGGEALASLALPFEGKVRCAFLLHSFVCCSYILLFTLYSFCLFLRLSLKSSTSAASIRARRRAPSPSCSPRWPLSARCTSRERVARRRARLAASPSLRSRTQRRPRARLRRSAAVSSARAS